MLKRPPKRTNKDYKVQMPEYCADIITPYLVHMFYLHWLATFDGYVEKFNLATGLSTIMTAMLADVTEEIGEVNFPVINHALQSLAVLIIHEKGLEEDERISEILTSVTTHVLGEYLKRNKGRYKNHHWLKFQKAFKVDFNAIEKPLLRAMAEVEK
jgi:hypothetical protein